MFAGACSALRSATIAGARPALMADGACAGPFHLRAPLPVDDQDRELVQPQTAPTSPSADRGPDRRCAGRAPGCATAVSAAEADARTFTICSASGFCTSLHCSMRGCGSAAPCSSHKVPWLRRRARRPRQSAGSKLSGSSVSRAPPPGPDRGGSQLAKASTATQPASFTPRWRARLPRHRALGECLDRPVKPLELQFFERLELRGRFNCGST